jgi:hypothetical protein
MSFWIKSYNWFQTFCMTKTCPFYESTCSLDELDEKPNYTKNPKSWNFETKIKKENDFLKKPFDKTIMCNGFKISSILSKLKFASNMVESYKCIDTTNENVRDETKHTQVLPLLKRRHTRNY